MVQIRITKEFLDKYRQYKMDLLEGKVGEDINYKVLEHLIANGIMSLQKLYEELGDYKEITVALDTGEVVDYKIEKRTIKGDEHFGEPISYDFEEYVKAMLNEKEYKSKKWDLNVKNPVGDFIVIGGKE